MTQVNKYTILVNTSDGFDDCWPAFFYLFDQYWPECKAPIFLNTETKDFKYPGLDIKCTKAQLNAGAFSRLTWSECLIFALTEINTPYVLYLQEDYFIEQPVNVGLVEEMVSLMAANHEIKHIGLTHFGSHGPFLSTQDQRLWKISLKAKYRISSQAGLWRVETLLAYLRQDENGWMFETFGSRRARRLNETFLTLNRDIFNPEGSPVIQYTHTGIIKGKWHPQIPKLFSQHNITVDFNIRGIYLPEKWFFRKLATLKKICSSPRLLFRFFVK
jgi:hypothetical protein